MTQTLHRHITMIISLVAQMGSQSGIRSDVSSPHCSCHFPSVGLLKVLLVQLATLLKILGGHVAQDCGSHESNMPYKQSVRSKSIYTQL